MKTRNYAPWEHYPKTLSHTEVLEPLEVISEFFNCGSVKQHRKQLKKWHYYAMHDGYYHSKVDGPGLLLFEYDLNLKLLEATYLLLLNYRRLYHCRKNTNRKILRSKKKQNAYFPGNLSIKELLNPYIIIEKTFRKISPQGYRDHLRVWLHSALYKKSLSEILAIKKVPVIYANLCKLYSAAWLIYRRECIDREKDTSRKAT